MRDKARAYSIVIVAGIIFFTFALSALTFASTAEIYYSMGQGYMGKGKYDMATLAFEKAIESNPEWPEARNALGEAYVKLLRFDDALVQFSKAIELKPDYTEAKINYRRTMMSADRYKPIESPKLSNRHKLSILGVLTIAIAVIVASVIYYTA